MLERLASDASGIARWREGLAIVNLRGRPDEAGFAAAVAVALGMPLPTEPCRTVESGARRVVWVGPDDWFVLDASGRPDVVTRGLREAVAGCDAAVTDVSSGYSVLRLSGPSARDALAAGCPLDLHPRTFGVGHAAGSHFFKASVWVWQVDVEPVFEMLVRRSFVPYVRLMLERAAP